MKKSVLLLLLVSAFGHAQIVNIPDANFKQRLLMASPEFPAAYAGGQLVAIDTNDNYEIEVSEALAIDSLFVTNANVTDLTGIGAFSNLKGLSVGANQLTGFDLSALTSLKTLRCPNNLLASLDISSTPALEKLDCSVNPITSLAISGAPQLQWLKCVEGNLTVLDFSNSAALKWVACAENNFTSFNFTGLTAIEVFSCNGNNLGSLDVSMLAGLKRLECGACNLTNLNVVGLANLEWLLCESNPLGTINTTGLSGLKYFAPTNCQLTTLDLTGLASLIELNCTHNQLATLNISVIPGLASLFAENNLITNIDFSSSVGLQQFTLQNNLLTAVDLSNTPNLLGAGLGYNPQLTTVNIKNGTNQANDFWADTALAFICADESEIEATETVLSDAEISGVVVNSYCSFQPGGTYNTISGVVRFDADGNGCDSSDPVFSGVRVGINDGLADGATFTDANGAYAFFVQQPSLTLTPSIENPAFFNISPGTSGVAFFGNDFQTEVRDFCVTANGVHNDVEILFAPTIPARPGFDATYQIIYRNKGNQVLGGNITLAFQDALLDFVSSSVAPDATNTGNLGWNYAGLLPFETRTITVVFNVNSPIETPAVNIGDELNFSAAINPVAGDELPPDNVFGLKQVVVGSFDPNDKQCLQGSIVSPVQIGNYLHYVINFENTGNFPAENVVVKDMIDGDKFDVSTIQVLGASHSEVPVVSGNKVEFIFQDIDLAPNAYGYVAYKIKTKPTLPVGTTVTNKANIYFDFNIPIETNTASTTFQSLGVGEHGVDASVRVFPNPARQTVGVESGSAIRSVTVYDMQGRKMMGREFGTNNVSVDISSLASGVYLVKIITDTGAKTERLLKE